MPDDKRCPPSSVASPLHDIPPGALVLGDERAHGLTDDVVHDQCHIGRLRQRVLDRRRWVERVRKVVCQREFDRQRLQGQRRARAVGVRNRVRIDGCARDQRRPGNRPRGRVKRQPRR